MGQVSHSSHFLLHLSLSHLHTLLQAILGTILNLVPLFECTTITFEGGDKELVKLDTGVFTVYPQLVLLL